MTETYTHRGYTFFMDEVHPAAMRPPSVHWSGQWFVPDGSMKQFVGTITLPNITSRAAYEVARKRTYAELCTIAQQAIDALIVRGDLLNRDETETK